MIKRTKKNLSRPLYNANYQTRGSQVISHLRKSPRFISREVFWSPNKHRFQIDGPISVSSVNARTIMG